MKWKIKSTVTYSLQRLQTIVKLFRCSSPLSVAPIELTVDRLTRFAPPRGVLKSSLGGRYETNP